MQSNNSGVANVVLEQLLDASRESAEIIALLDESLFALSQKRSTLEEKAISKYFHQLASLYGSILSLMHDKVLENCYMNENNASSLKLLRTHNEKVSNKIKELLKIIRYNLNYLEQYYEYDYAAELCQSSQFLEDLQEIKAKLANN